MMEQEFPALALAACFFAVFCLGVIVGVLVAVCDPANDRGRRGANNARRNNAKEIQENP